VDAATAIAVPVTVIVHVAGPGGRDLELALVVAAVAGRRVGVVALLASAHDAVAAHDR
jgi:hypothetical protein